jgi:hypothetical protein
MKNDLKPTDFLKRNFYFETEGVTLVLSSRLTWKICSDLEATFTLGRAGSGGTVMESTKGATLRPPMHASASSAMK